jgi:hypothetical protein
MYGNDPNFNVVLLVTIILGIMGAVPVFIAVIIANNARKKREAEIIRLAVEKGQPMPEFRQKSSRYGTLKAGLIWIAVGIGIALMVLIEGEGRVEGISFGIIPLLVGVVLCFVWGLESKEMDREKLENKSINTL